MYDAQSARKDLVFYGRKIEEKNLVVGPGGNTSARAGGVIYMKASGTAFEDAGPEDYVGVDLKTGEVVDGSKKPSCEILMHLGCYAVREDVAAVVHTHSPCAVAVASAGVAIPPMFPDFIALLGTEVPTIDYVVPAGKELADRVVAAVKKHNVVLLANHGVVALGGNVREAYFRALAAEAAAQIYLMSKLLGSVPALSAEQVNEVNSLQAEDYRRALLRGWRNCLDM